jgi:hypothetical protein
MRQIVKTTLEGDDGHLFRRAHQQVGGQVHSLVTDVPPHGHADDGVEHA